MKRLLTHLNNSLPAPDKLAHYFYGSLIAAACLFVLSPLASIAVVALIAFAKEIYDGMGYGTKEVADALWTIAGGVVVVVSVIIATTINQ